MSTFFLIFYTTINRTSNPASANPNNVALESVLSEFRGSLITETASTSGIIPSEIEQSLCFIVKDNDEVLF